MTLRPDNQTHCPGSDDIKAVEDVQVNAAGFNSVVAVAVPQRAAFIFLSAACLLLRPDQRQRLSSMCLGP